MPTPLIAALEAILKWKHGSDSVVLPEALFEESENGRYVVADYMECIDSLWHLIGNVPTGAPQRDLVVAWAPTEPLDRFNRHLTLYDWVVALVQNAPSGCPPPLRVFVIDLAPEPLTHGERMAGTLAEHLPWFRVFRPCSRAPELIHLVSKDDGLRQEAAKLLAHYLDLEQLLSVLWISDIGTSLDRWRPLSGSTTTLLRDLWVNEITKPEGRHGISNLVAPLVLERALSPAQTTLQTANTARTRLVTLLDALGILPKQGQSAWKSLQKERFIEDNVFGSFITQHVPAVNFLLIDDHGCHYNDLLKQILSPFSLGIETTPEPLIRWLEHLGPSCFDAGQINVIGHPPEGTELASFNVLLLDLRLFDTESAVGKSAERTFLKRLIDVCADQSNRHSHSELVNSLVSSAKSVLEKNGESLEQPSIDHLALLPVLLALADPSLPIVLFSSTRQRDVIDKVAAFPNIITTFAKPIVAGYGIHPTDHVGRLRSALVQALRLHENRAVWHRIADLPSNGAPAPTLIWARGIADGSKRPNDIPAVDFVKENQLACFNLKAIDDSFESKSSPILGWKAVKRTLRFYFEYYILRSNYHDFAALPFDFLEVACAPPQKRASRAAFWQSAQVEIKPGLPIDLLRFKKNHKHKLELLRRNDKGGFSLAARRNTLAYGLQQIRNRKSHGYGPTAFAINSTADTDAFRIPSLLQLSTLIDFLRGEKRTHAEPLDWPGLCQVITTNNTIPNETLRPDQITTSSQVAWEDYVLFCLAWAYAEAPEYYSDTTAKALFALMKAKWFRGASLPVGSSAGPICTTDVLAPGSFVKASSAVKLEGTSTIHPVGREHFAKDWSDGTKVLLWFKEGEPWHVEFVSS